jgi:hypothetical protein
MREQSKLVCSYNRFAKPTEWREFAPDVEVGPRSDLLETPLLVGMNGFVIVSEARC